MRVPAGVGEFLEEDVGLAVEDAMALLDHRDADRLGQVALPRAGRAEEESVLMLRDEAAGGELEDEVPIHLLVEVEVKGVDVLPWLPTQHNPAQHAYPVDSTYPNG